jgi:hypothetical protein
MKRLGLLREGGDGPRNEAVSVSDGFARIGGIVAQDHPRGVSFHGEGNMVVSVEPCCDRRCDRHQGRRKAQIHEQADGPENRMRTS